MHIPCKKIYKNIRKIFNYGHNIEKAHEILPIFKYSTEKLNNALLDNNSNILIKLIAPFLFSRGVQIVHLEITKQEKFLQAKSFKILLHL